jgi:hypothetical protein
MKSFIVEKVISRSITGFKIGIDIHSHYNRKLHLCWKYESNTKCIERYDEDNGSEFDQKSKSNIKCIERYYKDDG